MKITPLEIRKKSFEKAFRGYEKEEVDAFLRSLSQEWEKLMDENRETSRRLDIAEKEVQRLRDVENSLFKTLKSAENAGANVLEQANRAAELHLKEAQINAEGLLNEAKSRAKNLIEEAEERAREILDEMQEEVKAIVKEYNYIEDQKELLIQSIQTLINETTERVERAVTKSGRRDMEKKLREVKSMIYDRKTSEPLVYTREEPPVKQEKKNQSAPESQSTDNQSTVVQSNQPGSEIQEEKKQNEQGDQPQGSFFDNI